jgi:hypothetical protein
MADLSFDRFLTPTPAAANIAVRSNLDGSNTIKGANLMNTQYQLPSEFIHDATLLIERAYSPLKKFGLAVELFENT